MRHYLAPGRCSSTSACISKRPGLGCSAALRGKVLCVEPTLGNELRRLQLHLHGLDTLINVNKSQKVGGVCVSQHLQPAPSWVALANREALLALSLRIGTPDSFLQSARAVLRARSGSASRQSRASYSACPKIGLPSRTAKLSCDIRDAAPCGFSSRPSGDYASLPASEGQSCHCRWLGPATRIWVCPAQRPESADFALLAGAPHSRLPAKCSDALAEE